VRRAALCCPPLWLAQREFGWISEEAMVCVAKLVGVSPMQVMEVAGFYTMYQKNKPGKYHLQVCQTIACLLAGSEEIKKTIERVLDLKPGQTTPDGQFSYQTVECLASCHTAPCMQVNDDYHENLTPESTEKLIAELRKK
jgi:NADH-quinone oxidoreductase E subunit